MTARFDKMRQDEELFTYMRITSSAIFRPQNLIKNMIAGTPQAGTAHILAPADGNIDTAIDKMYQKRRGNPRTNAAGFAIEHSPCDEAYLQLCGHDGM